MLLAGGHPWSDRARIRAASLWGGDRSAVSGPAAAWWHGMLTSAPAEVELTVPRRSGLRAGRASGSAGGTWHLSTERRSTGCGWPRSRSPPWRPPSRCRTGRCSSTGRCSGTRIRRGLPGYCRNLGARGGAGIAVLLVAAADRADSAAERLMISIMRGAGAERLGARPPVRPVDDRLRVPGREAGRRGGRLAWRMDVDRFRADRHKGNALVRAGWDVLRFTWHDLQPAGLRARRDPHGPTRRATARP